MKAMDRKAIPRRQYSEEFKREAVRLVEEGLSLCERLHVQSCIAAGTVV